MHLISKKLKLFSFFTKNYFKPISFKNKMETSLKVSNSAELKQFWDDFAGVYSELHEYSTQPILYSLIVNLKIYEAINIFEASCGGGKSLSLVCSLKRKDCEYLVSDLSENMLCLASKRMEYIENNINGNLQFYDNSLFLSEKKVWNENFPNSKVSFKLLNNENLVGLENESLDVVFSNLSLHLVENPVNMLNEAYRVLRKGGKAGFTVWGRRENSNVFTTIPMVLRKNGVELPKERSNFHLENREALITMAKTAGFKDILCWYQFFAFNMDKEEDFENLLETKGIKKMMESFSQEKRDKIRKEIIESFMKNLKENNEPVGLEALFVIGWK